MEEKVTELYWDGQDLITRLENGQTWRFTEAQITNIKLDDEWTLFQPQDIYIAHLPYEPQGDIDVIDLTNTLF